MVTARGSPLRAARIWGTAEQQREAIGSPLSPAERSRYEQRVTTSRAAAGDNAAFDRAWREGRALSLKQATELALKDPTSDPADGIAGAD